ARYTPADFISLVERHHIPYHEKKLGQLFCDRSAHDISGMLEQECHGAGVAIQTNANVREVRKGDDFVVQTEAAVFHAPCLVVATGGLSVPKIGATSFGYELARQFGLSIQAPRPALVPLVFAESERKQWCDLAGVSTEVVASVQSSRLAFREQMLFTHRGISGPVILQISSYWNGQEPISLDLVPDRDLAAELRSRGHRDAASWKALLREVLPRRLADRWLEVHPLVFNSDLAFAEAERQLHGWKVLPEGTEGYGKAEVTAGGVDTGELSAKTMESMKIPGLFLIGEVVDVTGQLGGFNFQWAWASGFCAGQAL
ncbi:MAG: aminoacetone oxidase family FAD-binding enzyme, partial [Acidobacteriales bacterium]|nr:aminoacetone oxidase family FAD-binding enzyme [Terriglobales bacterium]